MVAGAPTSLASVRFLELLGEDEMAFDNLFCVAFQMMDVQWLAKRASYMEFNVKITKPLIIFFTILVLGGDTKKKIINKYARVDSFADYIEFLCICIFFFRKF